MKYKLLVDENSNNIIGFGDNGTNVKEVYAEFEEDADYEKLNCSKMIDGQIVFDEEKYRLTHIKNEIASTKAILSKTDYQIIKSMEYFLSNAELPEGLELPYDIKTIHESRETFRNKINKLEEEELNYILESETN